MGVVISTLHRIWQINYPPAPPKNLDAIRIGVLSPAWITSLALLTPSKSHPDVIITAVASRSLERAAVYAKKFGIEKWYGSYEELLMDKEVDAVYIPLPNGLHAHWARRALEVGKHVLVEKPFVSNSVSAQSLVDFHSSMPEPRPVLLEAFHFRFHPAWRYFLSLVEPVREGGIEEASAQFSVQAGFFGKDNIRWDFDLAGGALMDIGTYSLACLRDVFGCEPDEVVGAEVKLRGKDVEEGVKAWYRFPGGAVGSIDGCLAERGWWGLPRVRIPRVVVRGKEVEMKGSEMVGNGEVHVKRRTVTMWGFPGAHYWHSIEILDEHTIRRTADGLAIKSWKDTEYKTAYTWDWKDDVQVQDGAHWSTYRHMLDQFIYKIRGKEGSGVWISGEDSIKQMKAIDDTYQKVGLPIRLDCS